VALIDCPECGRQVSSLATACPDCAYPLQKKVSSSSGAPPAPTDDLLRSALATDRRARTAPNSVQTIEQTAKSWKAAQLIGGLLLVVAIPWGVLGGERAIGPSLFLGVIGLIVYLAARMGSWWHHG